MKNQYHYTFIISLLISINISPLYNQATVDDQKIYKIWITQKNNDPQIKGYLSAVEDSLTIIKNLEHFDQQKIFINDIDAIKYRRKGSINMGALIGSLSGVVVGSIAGYAQGDDVCQPGSFCLFTWSAEEKGKIGAAMVGLPAAMLGALIGSGKTDILVEDDMSSLKNELEKYVLPDR